MGNFSTGFKFGMLTSFMHNMTGGYPYGFTFGCGGWNNFNWNFNCCSWNSSPIFLTPIVNNFSFTPYINIMPSINLPLYNQSDFNFNSINQFNINNIGWDTFNNYTIPNYDYSRWQIPSFVENKTKSEIVEDIEKPAVVNNQTITKQKETDSVSKKEKKAVTDVVKDKAEPVQTGVGDVFIKEEPRTENKEVKTETKYKPIARKNGDFELMLAQVLKFEGNTYVKNDNGSPSYKGIKKETYESYRRKKGLPIQELRKITDSEVRDIYYEEYYLKSGADKIKDARLAFYVFDTAVNCGLGGLEKVREIAKQKGGNPDNPEDFENARKTHYKNLAELNPKRNKKYLKTWNRRVNEASEFVTKTLEKK